MVAALAVARGVVGIEQPEGLGAPATRRACHRPSGHKAPQAFDDAAAVEMASSFHVLLIGRSPDRHPAAESFPDIQKSPERRRKAPE